MLLENELIINDFICKDKFNLDGLIVNSSTNLSRLKNLITTNKSEVISFNNLNSFFETEIKPFAYCFINMDDSCLINEATSLRLFRKVRGKIKVIMYNETNCNLNDQEFFKFINWMRLITI